MLHSSQSVYSRLLTLRSFHMLQGDVAANMISMYFMAISINQTVALFIFNSHLATKQSHVYNHYRHSTLFNFLYTCTFMKEFQICWSFICITLSITAT